MMRPVIVYTSHWIDANFGLFPKRPAPPPPYLALVIILTILTSPIL
ncbi:MAG TPA: hypothetical protein VNA27_12755 [Rubrobacteraceae bacterium]|nr:hypothetical protein [Rubrobacteraceae bacterium]